MARAVTPQRKALNTIIGWTIGVLIFFPIFWIVILSFKSEVDAIRAPLEVLGSDWTTSSYAAVQARSDYFKHFLNSVTIAVGSTLLGLIIAVPAAWAMAFVPRPGTKNVLMWMLSTKMLPPVGVLIPIYLIFRDTGLLDTRTGLVIVLMLINLPIIVWMLYTYFREIPGEILEAARMDGANLRNDLDDRGWRVLRVRRPLGLRQVHPAAHDRRAGGHPAARPPSSSSSSAPRAAAADSIGGAT
jgi:sorbitol/mannitol transport system permease protein